MAPQGAVISLAAEGYFQDGHLETVTAGMLLGQVYRFRVTGGTGGESGDLYPTIEVIDRLYPPPGLEANFAIPVELTADDLRLAQQGNFVTRVVYLEDVASALPVPQTADKQDWFDAGPGFDPLEVADNLGRPVAILRIGSRAPVAGQEPDYGFLYGCPPWVYFPPKQQVIYQEVEPTLAPTALPHSATELRR